MSQKSNKRRRLASEMGIIFVRLVTRIQAGASLFQLKRMARLIRDREDNMRRRISVSSIFIALFILVFFACGCSKKPAAGYPCKNSDKTALLPRDPQAVKIVFQNGKEEYYCTILDAIAGWADALDERNMERFTNPPVKLIMADYESKKLIDAFSASFVVGSNIKPVEHDISVVAFETQEDATKFAIKNGGEESDFDGLNNMGFDEGE